MLLSLHEGFDVGGPHLLVLSDPFLPGEIVSLHLRIFILDSGVYEVGDSLRIQLLPIQLT